MIQSAYPANFIKITNVVQYRYNSLNFRVHFSSEHAVASWIFVNASNVSVCQLPLGI